MGLFLWVSFKMLFLWVFKKNLANGVLMSKIIFYTLNNLVKIVDQWLIYHNYLISMVDLIFLKIKWFSYKNNKIEGDFFY